MPEDPPFDLIISALSPPGLKVEILNRSANDQVYCYDRFWQSCDLHITDGSGKTVHSDDRRIIMRPSMPIGESAFGTLGPAGREELIAEHFEKMGEGQYSLRWGYTTFRGLPSGTYEVVAVMECRYNSWADNERKWHTEKDVWLGTIRSNPTKINLL